MYVLQDFDPTATTNGTLQTNLGGCGKVYLFNESPNSLTLQYHDSNGEVLGVLPAWYARAFTLTRPATVIYWSQRNTLSFTGTPFWTSHVPGASGSPQWLVQGESYWQGEDTSNLYVGPLVRQSNIGNQVSTVGGNAAAIVNDGNVNGTPIIEATPSGVSASTVSLTNDGIFTIKDTAGNIILKVDRTQANIMQLVRAGQSVENLGQLVQDQNLVVKGQTFLDVVGLTNNISTDGNGLLTILQNALSVAGKQVSHNGSTSGTFTIEQIFVGDFKLAAIKLNNYSDAAAQTLALPVAYTAMAFVVATSITFLNLISSGVAQNINVWSGLALTGGSSTPQTNLNQRSIGDINHAFDSVLVNTGTSRTGIQLLFGF